jgi:ABC-type glycerol-3-phosphate transport system permease component
MEKKEKSTIKRQVGTVNWILLGVLILYTLSMILLFVWGLSTSLKTRREWTTDKVWFPDGAPWQWGWENYETVLAKFYVRKIDKLGNVVKINFLGQLVNTILYAGVSSVVITAAYCITAYLTCTYN